MKNKKINDKNIPDKNKNSIHHYAADSYVNIGLDQLVVFSAKQILDAGEECTFERLVYECFSLFPEKFGFQRYPEWPDSARINKAWHRCRTDKGWIEGTVKKGFTITSVGEIIAKKTAREIRTGKKSKKVQLQKKPRERYEAVISYIKNSPEFTKYVETNNNELSLFELKSFLGGTLETPKRILMQNLNLYFQASTIYNEKSVQTFLKLCKKKLANIRE